MAINTFTNPVPLNDLPDTWQITSIDSLCEKVTSGGTPLRSVAEYYEGGNTPWIKTKELKDWYIEDAEEKITKAALENSSAKIFPPNTVLMAMYGDGRTITSLGLLRREAATNQACCAMIANPKECDYLYLFYALKFHREDFIHLATGGAQRNLSGTLIRNFAIRKPPLPEQRAIAGILGALDDKIEVNRRMNATLESIARAVFREMMNASLEGGEEKTIGDVVTIVGGSTPSTTNSTFWDDGDINWATPKDLAPLQSPFLLETNSRITELGLKEISSGLLPVGTVLLSSRAPIGYLAITQIPVAINQGFIAIKCTEEVPNYFVLNWLKENMEEIIGRANGTTFLEISKSNFRPMKITVPLPEKMKAFVEQVEPLYQKIVANLKESRTLASLQDSLLPKLMSGEVRVPV